MYEAARGTHVDKKQAHRNFELSQFSTSIIEIIEPMSKHLTVGKIMIFSFTCRNLYFSILSFYRHKIKQSLERPLHTQSVFEIYCPHHCNGESTSPFILKKGKLKAGGVQQDSYSCTRCLYSFKTSMSYKCTWWICPPHEQIVQRIEKNIGERHSLLFTTES